MLAGGWRRCAEDALDGCCDEVRSVHRHERLCPVGPDDLGVEQGGSAAAVAGGEEDVMPWPDDRCVALQVSEPTARR